MPEDLALRLLASALPQLEASFRHLPAQAEQAPAIEAMDAVMSKVVARMEDNYPYFHPLYAGQMLKPPHPLARAAYALAMTINPNNHALDGGRASSRMEVEAVREIAGMFGWTDYLGHLTSGGTFANLEGLWIAGQLAPGKRIVASEQAHYTHGRISGVLGLPFSSVPADAILWNAAARKYCCRLMRSRSPLGSPCRCRTKASACDPSIVDTPAGRSMPE